MVAGEPFTLSRKCSSRPARRDLDPVISRRFRSLASRIHSTLFAMDHQAVEGVFHIWRTIRTPEEPFAVRLVVGEQKAVGFANRFQSEASQRLVLAREVPLVKPPYRRLVPVTFPLAAPRPAVAIPDRWQQ